MRVRSSRWALSWPVFLAVLFALGCSSGEPSPTSTPAVLAGTEAQGEGRDLFIAKGCSGCHGEDAEGTSIGPALAGHSEEMVRRQVRTPRFRMPAFNEQQISDREIVAIANYFAGLDGEGHLHAEVTSAELTAAVEMHHWMALESLKADSGEDAIHHVGHIIDLLDDGTHRQRMQTILVSLRAGEIHDSEHDIEEMLAGTAVLGLTLADLHLRQALAALAADDLSDAQHHVAHFQETADAGDVGRATEILELFEGDSVHVVEHEIRELLGEEGHED